MSGYQLTTLKMDLKIERIQHLSCLPSTNSFKKRRWKNILLYRISANKSRRRELEYLYFAISNEVMDLGNSHQLMLKLLCAMLMGNFIMKGPGWHHLKTTVESLKVGQLGIMCLMLWCSRSTGTTHDEVLLNKKKVKAYLSNQLIENAEGRETG